MHSTPTGGAAPFVSGLTEAGSQVFASVSDGTSYRLWTSDDGRDWRPVTTPSTPSTAGEHIMSVSASGGSVLLLADDGETGRVWLAKPGADPAPGQRSRMRVTGPSLTDSMRMSAPKTPRSTRAPRRSSSAQKSV